MKILTYLFLIIATAILCRSSAYSQVYNCYIVKAFSKECSILDGVPIEGHKLCLIPKNKNGLPVVMCEYSNGIWFNEYNNDEKLAILEELLSFEGDTSICSKKVCNYGSKKFKKPKTILYTTQIDALYLFTNLVVSSYAPNYCPFPVLFDRKEKKEINDCQEKISQIFKIYREWLIGLRINGVKKFKVPLNDEKYEWFSTQALVFGYYKPNFWINGIYPSGRTTGVCVE
ncbi:hypothetical protein ACR78H_16840 [Sphingobacterium siyangense]|uniref:hypothetical protein n=1 Tax=Sphingobacterium siyangense TaxID=459529 RepID=UPI003DA432CC